MVTKISIKKPKHSINILPHKKREKMLNFLSFCDGPKKCNTFYGNAECGILKRYALKHYEGKTSMQCRLANKNDTFSILFSLLAHAYALFFM